MKFDSEVDTRELERGLTAMTDPKVLDRTARALKKPMRRDQADHAKSMEGPDGRWPARKKLIGRGKKVLRRNRRKLLGRLPRETRVYARRSSVVAESKAGEMADLHMTGGRVGRGAYVPARPFIWISDGLMTAAAAELQDIALRAWGGV